jgi:2-heptyl-3-hydroxy-4(1H)-quinolone synthase
MQNKRILIIGGGIAGLAMMNRLEAIGCKPTLVEKAQNIRSDGTGILLGINAISILKKMSLFEKIKNNSIKLSSMIAYDENGKKIVSSDLNYLEEKSGQTTHGIGREELFTILYESINKNNIFTNKEIIKVENVEDKVKVTYKNYDVEFYDLVIGADGINSTVRASIFGKIEFRDAKQGCWRFMVKTPKNFNEFAISEYFGLGKRAGFMPLKNNILYCYVLLNSDKFDKKFLPKIEDLMKHFEEFKGQWENISLEILKNQNFIFNEIKDLSQICIQKENIVLIGDASHAVTPNLGQGAALGLEDAFILADMLNSNLNIKDALKEFEEKRYKRVKMIRDKSFMIGKSVQSSSFIFSKIRNFIYRLMSDKFVTNDTFKTLKIW